MATKTSWVANKTGTTATSWSGGAAYGKKPTQDANSEFSTISIDGSSISGFSTGAWGNSGQEQKKEGTQNKFSFGRGTGLAKEEKGTAWGAMKKEQERKKEGRGSTGRGMQGKAGAKPGTMGFGANKFGTAGGFGTGRFATGGYGTGATTTYGAKTNTTTSTFSYKPSGTTGYGASKIGGDPLKKLKESEEYITSRGEPFISFPVTIETKNNEPKEMLSMHICSVPRFYEYPVEMLRYYDYVFGGGIKWVDPNPAEPAKADATKQEGFGLQPSTQLKNISPWTLELVHIKIDPEPAGQTIQPFGVLPATMVQTEQTHQDVQDDEDFTPIRQRGFLVSRTLFDNMKDYSGPSRTPGFNKIEPSHAKGFYF